ncbi:MAG: DUF6526 family protein [Bacteroidota bacterium]
MQNYKNHIRYYAPHHFIFYPIVTLLFAFSVWKAATESTSQMLWALVAGTLLLISWCSFMLRQHYGMTLQNRLVVLEMRFRYFALTSQRLEEFEDRLTFGQIAALRFAPDDELPELIKATLAQDLSPDQIKKSIKNWLPDHRRI